MNGNGVFIKTTVMKDLPKADDAAAAIMGIAFMSLAVFLWLKAIFHFKYLKSRGEFQDVDSLISIMLHPSRFFKYGLELFAVLWIPVFFCMVDCSYCRLARMFSWLATVVIVFIAIFINVI